MITYISLAEMETQHKELVARAEAAEREALLIGTMYDRLKTAAESLLTFIREKHPEDFAEGGRGFTCPHHAAINEALTA